MFFYFPFAVDAPLYHRPYGTIGLIVINILVFALVRGDLEVDWVLWYGDGLHPVQWLTSNFLHADLGHLLGNMVALWVFGLVVEGKVGTLRFVLLYLGIGVTESGLEQLVFQGQAEMEGRVGASVILYALMGISLIWAPRNEVQIFYFVFLVMIVRSGVVSLTVQTVALIFFGLDLLSMMFFFESGDGFSSVLHLVGAAVGIPVGIVMLKKGWVDCENWDYFSVRAGRHHRSAMQVLRRSDPDDADDTGGENEGDRVDERELYTDMIRESLAADDAVTALEIYRNSQTELGRWHLDRPDLEALIHGLFAARQWAPCLPLLSEYFDRFPGQSRILELRYGALLVKRARRPGKGLDVLKRIPPGELTGQEETLRQNLMELAQRKIEEGALELDDD